MQLRTVQYSDQLLREAKDFFLREGRSDFLVKKPLSLCGRYCISQKMKEIGCVHFIPEDGVYQCEEYTFALSYSEDKLFLGLDTQNIVVDIEKIIERDFSLLSPPVMTREAFYLQWCVKECLVKFLNLPSLEKALEQKITIPDNVGEEFVQVVITYQGNTYPAMVKQEQGYVFAVMTG